MIFTPDQLDGLWRGKVRAALVTSAETPATKRVNGSLRIVRPLRSVYREVIEHDPDGNRTGIRLERLQDSVVTVLYVERNVWITDVGLPVARDCGFRTTAQLREDWRRRHPRLDLASLVRFELGEARDTVRLISAGWPDYTYDPSRAMFGEPEPVSSSDVGRMSALAQQQHARARVTRSQDLAKRSAADRLKAIERARGRGAS